MGYPEPSFETKMGSIFGDEMWPISYRNNKENRITSVDVLLNFDGKYYSITLRALDDHLAASHYDDEVDDDGAYVINRDEILPSDLLELKSKTYEDLEPFLQEQVNDPELDS